MYVSKYNYLLSVEIGNCVKNTALSRFKLIGDSAEKWFLLFSVLARNCF